MRIRTIFLVVSILLLAGFVALNIDEFARVSMLSLGFTTIQLPLGLLLLFLLVIATVVFLASTLYMQSKNLLETRHYARELKTQRELADKAEASRFTELRSYLEVQALATQRREAAAATVMAERFAQQQQALLSRLEQSDNAVAAYMGQLEDQMERRNGLSSVQKDPLTMPLV